jgi:hypothetical protein
MAVATMGGSRASGGPKNGINMAIADAATMRKP